MYSRIVFGLCTIAIFLFLVSPAVAVAEKHFHPLARKLANAQWLSAPHFQLLDKRGRFVFREAQNDDVHDSTNDDIDNIDLHPDKRNWRL